MKKYIYTLFSILSMLLFACSDIDKDYTTYTVSVQLVYPESSPTGPQKDVKVKFTDINGSVYESVTNENGIATFVVPAGIYEASGSIRQIWENQIYLYNGVKSNISITQAKRSVEPVKVTLAESKAGQVILKELYIGGCPQDNGTGTFSNDIYVLLYNNTEKEAVLENLCMTAVTPMNSNATNNDYKDGKLSYESEGWIPSGGSFVYYPEELRIQPFEQKVIALRNAVNHTLVYSKSINFANENYYCVYDPVLFKGYSTPSERIPTSHYFEGAAIGTSGNVFTFSTTSPAFFIFQTKGISPIDFNDDSSKTNYHGGGESGTTANRRKRVELDWVLDGVEVFTTSSDKNQKRLTSTVDAGYVYTTSKLGYSLYRNVDQEATEALEGNQGKLVYNYNMGVGDSTDPSGIDAEASIRNGARIIYLDTNNSTNDFHERKEASLRY